MAPRGRGGKFSKPTRGGGKKFSRDVQPVDKDGNLLGMWRDPQDQNPSSEEDEDESGSEETSEEESEEDPLRPGPSSGAPIEATREERRTAAKARKAAALAKRKHTPEPGELPPSSSEDEDEIPPANPNHSAKSRSQATKPPSANETEDSSQLSRREREALQAQQARERYLKLHAEGKTEEARADLARLALVKERREAEKARREAEKEERVERERQKTEANEREAKLRAAALGPKVVKKGVSSGKPKK